MINQYLNKLSHNIWFRLKYSKSLNIPQGEVTLTENILLDIAINSPSEIVSIPTPKNKEKLTGTDFEWWIGNEEIGYIRYAIQAKKLNTTTGRYDTLNHKVNQIQQHKVLEKYAKYNKAIPLYILYNYVDKNNFNLHCSLACCYLNQSIMVNRDYGCTIARLSTIDRAIRTRGGRTFPAIHSEPTTIPLKCLPCKSKANTQIARQLSEIESLHYKKLPRWEKTMISFEDFPKEFYDHAIGYYPKNILVINIDKPCEIKSPLNWLL